jgi:hypothetical protein
MYTRLISCNKYTHRFVPLIFPSRIASRLTDGQVPIDSINIHLTDLVVQSLLEMPEHSHLVRNWPMMLKAIQNLHAKPDEENREIIAKQRVLLRFLIAAAELNNNTESASEVGGRQGRQGMKRKRNSKQTEDSRDNLSVALMKHLPSLIANFKGDRLGLQDVTQLPLAIPVSVFTLASRKTDLQNVMKGLCQLYLDSTDEKILANICDVFAHWLTGDHARITAIKAQLLRLSAGLQDRLMDLFRESEEKIANVSSPPSKGRRKKSRTPRTGESSVGSGSAVTDMFVASPQVETEHALSMSLLRWRLLLTACPSDVFFESVETGDGDEKEDEVVGFFNTISEGAGKRLNERRPIRDDGGDDESTIGGESKSVITIWKSSDGEIHEEVAKTVEESLGVLLRLILWKTTELLDRHAGESSDDMDVDSDNNVLKSTILDMRNRLITLLAACFDQIPAAGGDTEYPEEQELFASTVMKSASKLASDLRTAFPDFWRKAEDSTISSLALANRSNDVSKIVAGNGRYFQEREKEERGDDEEDQVFMNETILPVGRCMAVNPNDYFRKEAALILSHISNSGKSATDVALTLTRLLKKVTSGSAPSLWKAAYSLVSELFFVFMFS